MAKKEVLEVKPVSRPTDEVLETIGAEVSEYIEWMEARYELLASALETQPGAESRGLVWLDFFGFVRDEEGNQHELKFNCTQRSDISMEHAFRQLINGAQIIRGEFKVTPYFPTLIKTKSKGNGSTDEPQDLEQQPEGQPEGEALEQAAEGRQRRRKRDPDAAAANSTQKESKSPDEIGTEKWYPVKSMKIVLSQDETQKYIYAKIGRWTKHGKPAYLDSSGVPEDVVTMIETESWKVGDASITGVELKEDFPDMQFALLSADEKVIVGFANKPPA